MQTRFLPGSGPGSFTLDAQGRIEFLEWADGRLTWRAERDSGWIAHSWSAPGIRVAWVRRIGDVSVIVRDGFAASVPAYSTWVLERWLCCGG